MVSQLSCRGRRHVVCHQPGCRSCAQMAHRLKGSIHTGAGAPIAGATIRADVLSGLRGELFAGQKEHSIKSVDKGGWNMPGIEAGSWLFSTSPPGMVPRVQ